MASLLLARYGVSSMLGEQHLTTSVLPRATGINVRTMEILRSLGLEEDVRSKSPDTRELDYIVETTVFGGHVVDRVSYPRDVDVNDPDAPSLSQWCFLAQDEFEPILWAALRRHSEARVRFETKLAGFDQDERGITARLRGPDGGSEHVVRARYLVAADGARSGVRRDLGIGMSGRDHLWHSLNVLFDADLAAAVRGCPALLHLVRRPDPLGTGMFRNLDGEGQRWSLFTNWFEGASPIRCAEVVRDYVANPALNVDVRAVGEWEAATLLADTFRCGRVFLAGDAAHTVTPAGGMGMNTAIQDAHNLAWKLAGVLHGWAGDALLETYETERRPVGARTVDLSYELFTNPDRRAGANLLGHFLGTAYVDGALVEDGTPPDSATHSVAEYRPTARPGHRAPHCWLMLDGHMVSTLDLFDTDFTILSPADDWCATASRLRVEFDVPLAAHVITDPEWMELYGVGGNGAVLVRPDGYVAWRTRQAAALEPLRDVLAAVLARESRPAACNAQSAPFVRRTCRCRCLTPRPTRSST